MSENDDVLLILRRLGLIRPGEAASLVPLTGGVSSDTSREWVEAKTQLAVVFGERLVLC